VYLHSDPRESEKVNNSRVAVSRVLRARFNEREREREREREMRGYSFMRVPSLSEDQFPPRGDEEISSTLYVLQTFCTLYGSYFYTASCLIRYVHYFYMDFYSGPREIHGVHGTF